MDYTVTAGVLRDQELTSAGQTEGRVFGGPKLGAIMPSQRAFGLDDLTGFDFEDLLTRVSLPCQSS